MSGQEAQRGDGADTQAAGDDDGGKHRSKRPGGDNFAVCAYSFAKALALGICPALVYLTLARGTGGDNRTTSWGAEAVVRYGLMGLRRAKDALLALEKAGLISPRGHRGLRNCRIFAEPILGDGEEVADLIWLPNRLIGAAPGDISPLKLLREAEGSVTALALLMVIHHRCNLVVDGGVHPSEISARRKLKPLGERAAWQVYGMLSCIWHFTPEPSPLSHFLPKAESGGYGPLLNLLDSLSLIRCVGYVFDRAPEDGGEPMHPVGWGGEEAEASYGEAHCRAAEALLERIANTEKKKAALRQGFDVFVAVGKHVRAPVWVQLVRPRWLAHTSHHHRWFAKIQQWKERAESDAAAMTGLRP